MIRTLGLLFLAAACFIGSLSASDCKPSCVDTSSPFGPKKCYPPTTMVEDPMNCTNYYFCLSDCQTTQVPLPCDSGTVFDPVEMDCRPADPSTPCTASCKPDTCHLTCNGTGDLISDIKNCSRYHICLPHGVEGPYTCPPNTPYFNGDTCVIDDSDCCSDQCTPWCETKGEQVPDPLDCKKYYICVEEGVIPEEDVHFTCGTGETFDVAAGRCTTTAECKVLCSDAGGGGGGSSSSPAGTTSAVGGTTTAQSATGPGLTTPSVIPTSECQDSVTCTGHENVPKCLSCQQEYFYCPAAGEAGQLRWCPGDLVFNTDPSYPFCVKRAECPYSPPR